MSFTTIIFAIAFLFPVVMAISMSFDLLTMTIPNSISLVLVAGYLVSAAAARLPLQEVLFNLSCGAAVLSATFLMFSFRWIGGGDAKFAAATALWMGWSAVLDYGVTASICGGLLTLGLLVARNAELPAVLARLPWLLRLHDKKTGVPYGIALGAAGLLQYPHTQIWTAMVG